MTGWLAERRAAGWVAEAEDVRVRGFPNRVDTVVTDLDLSDPAGGLVLAAPTACRSSRSPTSRTTSSPS